MGQKFFLLDILTLQMGPIVCPETSVRNYNYTLRNVPEEYISHLIRFRSLKSRQKQRIVITSCSGKFPFANNHRLLFQSIPTGRPHPFFPTAFFRLQEVLYRAYTTALQPG